MSVLKKYNEGTSQWEAVVVGKQGPSGTVAVTAPLTNSGTSTAAVLGVDYAALQYGQNFVINGGMDIWQRGTSVTNPVSTSRYLADRWVHYRFGWASGMVVSQQAAGIDGITNSIRLQRTAGNTATDAIGLVQDSERLNGSQLAGKTVTLSFYAKKGSDYSASGSALAVSINTSTSTTADEAWVSGMTGMTTPGSTNATLTTSWQRFTLTATLPSNTTQTHLHFLYTPVGTAGTNDYFEVTGVQLELGSVATPFKRHSPSIQGELAACQRYFQRWSYDNSGDHLGNGQSSGGNGVRRANWNTIVSMRTRPSVSYSGTITCYRGDGSGSAVTSFNYGAGTTVNRISVDLATAGSMGTAGDYIFILFSSGAYVDASAEL